MKIAMVFDKLLWGGIERVGISYVQLFIEMGYTVDVYILDKKTEDIFKDFNKKCKIYIMDFPQKLCPESSWGYAIEPDFHGFEKIYFALRYFFLKILQPIIKLRYGKKSKKYDIAIAFSGHLNDLTFVAEQYVKSDAQVAWLHGTEYSYNMISPGFFSLYRKIKNLVCLSNFLDIECEKFNKNNHIKKRKIYNPLIIKSDEIDIEKVSYLKHEYGDFCLMIGRLAEDKDQETAILSVKCLKEKYNMNKKLILVGDGTERAALEQFVVQQNMQENVFFMGACSDVQNYYSAATIYVHSSPFEGLPTVILEAMGFGVPIAATDSLPGVREIMGDNEYGLISPIGDPIQLANNIKLLYDDLELRKYYIAKEKERLRYFSAKAIKEEIRNFFEDLYRGE